MDAQFVIEVENKYMKDVDMAAKVGAVDITPVEQEKVNDWVLSTDSGGVVSSPGVIQRTILVTLTADFLTKFPDPRADGSSGYDDRWYALTKTFSTFFSMQIPSSVNETLTLI